MENKLRQGKELHPGVIAVIVVVTLGVVGFFFYRGTATPPPQNMSPQGPAGAMMKAGGVGGRMTPDVLEAQKRMQQGKQSGQ